MCFLTFILLTPIGWIGMICFGVALSMIIGANSEAKDEMIMDIKNRMPYMNEEELKEYINGL